MLESSKKYNPPCWGFQGRNFGEGIWYIIKNWEVIWISRGIDEIKLNVSGNSRRVNRTENSRENKTLKNIRRDKCVSLKAYHKKGKIYIFASPLRSKQAHPLVGCIENRSHVIIGDCEWNGDPLVIKKIQQLWLKISQEIIYLKN